MEVTGQTAAPKLRNRQVMPRFPASQSKPRWDQYLGRKLKLQLTNRWRLLWRRMRAESSRGLSKGVPHFCEFCLREEKRRKREGDLGKEKNGKEEWWEGGKKGSRKKVNRRL